MLVQKIELTFINLVKNNGELRANIANALTEKLGQRPANFYPEEVKSSRSKHGRTGLYLIYCLFNADNQSIAFNFALKEFKTPEEAQWNRIAQQELLAKIRGTDVLSAKVLCQEQTMLVYEGIEGDDYYESALALDKKLFLAGKALAAFHGPRIGSLDRERYQVVLEATLKLLPVPEDRRTKLRSNGWILINEILNGFTGTVGYGDYHAGNLMFDYQEKIYLIDPEFKETDVAACRFEDIATFFLDQGLRLVQQTGKLFLEGVFDKFLAGYEAYLYQFGMSLSQMLGERNRIYAAFFFHLGLSSLLEALYTLRKVDEGEVEGVALDKITLCISVATKSFKQGLKYLGKPATV